MRYQIIENIVPRTIMNSHMLISVGERALEHNEIVELSEPGMFLWDFLTKMPGNIEELAAALLQEYDVDEETARRDTEWFVRDMLAAGLLIRLPGTEDE